MNGRQQKNRTKTPANERDRPEAKWYAGGQTFLWMTEKRKHHHEWTVSGDVRVHLVSGRPE